MDNIHRGTHKCPGAICLAYAIGICANAHKHANADARLDHDAAEFESSARSVPARETIVHPKDWQDFAPVVCDGWAVYSIVDRDAHRQIISFLLPGDVVSTAWLWESNSPRLIQALTHVTYRQIKRDVVKDRLLNNRDLCEVLAKFRNAEISHCEELAFILGRNGGERRIARLILHLSERLKSRGMMHDGLMVFPLRQREIADATGLSIDYVNRIFLEFQRANLIAVKNGTLEILNEAELRSLT